MDTPALRGRHRGTHAGGALHAASRVGKIFAAGCSMLIFVGFGYGWYNYNSLTTHTHSIDISGLGEPTPTPAPGASTSVHHVTGSAQNILIVGVDSRAGLTTAQKRYYQVGEDDQSTSTDTIIVVHVPADGKRATLVSIPRDTYVPIPGYDSNKINAAYADGYTYGGATTPEGKQSAGASELVATVKQLTGLSIDHYVQVGFIGFVNIVRAIGKVPITLCDSVDDTYAHNRTEGISGASGFKMTAGRHYLDPQQALEFVRQRHNIPGPVSDDLGREERQRYFLRAAFAKIASANVLLNPFRLKHLISAVDTALTFDNHNFGIQQFAEQMSDLTAGNIKGRSIPTTGNQNFGGTVGDALTVNTVAVQKFVHRIFYPTAHRSTHRSAAASSSSSSATQACVH